MRLRRTWVRGASADFCLPSVFCEAKGEGRKPIHLPAAPLHHPQPRERRGKEGLLCGAFNRTGEAQIIKRRLHHARPTTPRGPTSATATFLRHAAATAATPATAATAANAATSWGTIAPTPVLAHEQWDGREGLFCGGVPPEVLHSGWVEQPAGEGAARGPGKNPGPLLIYL